MTTFRRAPLLARIAAGLLVLCTGSAWSYSCNVSVTGTGVLLDTYGANQDSNGTVTLNCTRSNAEATTLTYRIKADNGLNYSGQRRARRGTSGNYLGYWLQRGTAVGGSAACANATNWLEPATGNTNVITGTLNFGSSLSASAVWGYCVRLPSVDLFTYYLFTTAGSYTDTVNIYAQYPGVDGGALTPEVPLNYTVGVKEQCIFNSFPTRITFNYTSFSATAQTDTEQFNLRCSNSLPWTVAVSPTNATALGLNYTMGITPAAGTGNGANQPITLTGTMPAGQSGTCALGSCAATVVHTVTISY
jgi:spore coat protein U-like protein